MPEPVVHIEQLGKRYRSAPAARRHTTLRDRLSVAAWRPWRRADRSSDQTATPPPASGFWALRDVTLDVAAGEIVGIVGHNGSGKSTLLKILARITEPTTGYATVRGRVGAMLEVGTGFHMELTGRENVFLSGAILGMRRAEIRRKFAEIVATSGVERFLDTPVKRYSTGMYLRLAFSVAVHLESEVLLLDEVLSVGDAAFAESSTAAIRALAVEGRGIVLVSHDFDLVRRLCSRAVLLEAGRIKAVGAPADVIGAAQQALAA